MAEALVSGVEVMTCGSYRRGKPTCGDVDLLISHPDGRSHAGLFSALLQRGQENGQTDTACARMIGGQENGVRLTLHG